MQEKDMLNALQKISENLTIDGDRSIYQQMLILLDNMRYFLYNDLQINYPIDKHLNIKQDSYDF